MEGMLLGKCADKTASRKYKVRMPPAMAAYFGLVCASVHWLERHPPVPSKYAIALLPVLPLLRLPKFVVDELERKIQLESLGFAFAVMALSALTHGFFDYAGLPYLNWAWVWLITGMLWAAGLFAARWRYR
jgi:hypothetical protein